MQLTPLLAGQWRTVKNVTRSTRERESALMPNKRVRVTLIIALLLGAVTFRVTHRPIYDGCNISGGDTVCRLISYAHN